MEKLASDPNLTNPKVGADGTAEGTIHGAVGELSVSIEDAVKRDRTDTLEESESSPPMYYKPTEARPNSKSQEQKRRKWHDRHPNGVLVSHKGVTWERAKRNAPCPCGSGKKYKRCCREADYTKAHTHTPPPPDPNALQAMKDKQAQIQGEMASAKTQVQHATEQVHAAVDVAKGADKLAAVQAAVDPKGQLALEEIQKPQ